jgi:hypothetical protein
LARELQGNTCDCYSMFQIRNPKSLETTRLNPVISVSKLFAPYKSSILSSLPLEFENQKFPWQGNPKANPLQIEIENPWQGNQIQNPLQFKNLKSFGK